MDNKIRILIIVLVLVGTGLIVGRVQQARKAPTEIEAEKSKRGIPVKVAKVRKDKISKQLNYTGRVELNQKVKIAPQVGGKIKDLKVEIGDRVNEGELLVELDHQELQLAVAKARKSVSEAKINLQQIKLNLTDLAQKRKKMKLNLAKNQAGWQGLEAKIDEARANLEKLKNDYHRNKKIFAKEAISESELDTTKAKYKAAVAKVNNLKAQQEEVEIEADKLEVKLGQLDIKQKLLEKDLQKAKLGVKLAKDGLEEAKIKLNYATVTAPQEGVIINELATTGEVVGRGKPLLHLGVDNKVKVTTAVSAQDLRVIKPGIPAKLTFTSLPNQIFNTKVNKIYPVIDQSGLTRIEFLLDNNDHKLKQGMVAQIKIITQDRKQSLIVPQEAIFSEEATEYLYLIKDGHAVKKEVSTGIDNGSQVEIITPLKDNALVATTNQRQLKDGAKVYVWNKEEAKQ